MPPTSPPSPETGPETASGAVRPVYVCTHHRCGTVLMRNVFRRYARFTGQGFFKGDPAAAPEGTAIVHDAHSRSPDAAAGTGVHIFRDPFDLLLSHVRYHETTTSPTEPPNALRMEDGRTYREHLLEKPTLSDKAMFEIDHVYGRTLRSMLAWDYDNPRFHNYPLDLFLDPATAGRVSDEIAGAFDVFAGRADDLRGAMLHFVGTATHIRAKHGTRADRTAPARTLFPDAVIDRLYTEFPALRACEERFAEALSAGPEGRT